MKIAMMTFILTAVTSVSSYAADSYNAVAAYGACQEDGLKGVRYALELKSDEFSRFFSRPWRGAYGQRSIAQ